MRNYVSAPANAVGRARRLRRDSTDAETRLWRGLREAFPTAKFRRQSPIGPYIVDFLSFGHQLVIEVDGGQHDPADAAEIARTAFLEDLGYRVLRFWNHEALGNADGVLIVIGAALFPHPDPLPKGEEAGLSRSPFPVAVGEGG